MRDRLPWRRALPYAFLLALTTAVFFDGLLGEFVLDDVPLVRGFSCSREPLEPLKGLFLVGSGDCAYRPLRYLTYALDRAVYGENPVGYHVTNLLLHLAMTVLVFLFLRRLLRARREPAGPAPPGGGTDSPEPAGGWTAEFGALAGAAIFAVHPVQADSVTYIAGRRDVLHALLYLGCILAWLRYRDGGRRAWAVAVVPLYYLALQAKEMAVTLPVTLLLLEAALNRIEAPPTATDPDAGKESGGPACGTGGWSWAVRAYLRPLRRHPWLFGALFALGIAFFLYRGVAQPLTHHPGFWGGSRLANTATAFGTLPGYVRLVLWPGELMVDYSADAYPIQAGFDAALPIAGVLILLALAGITLVALRTRPLLALAAGWFVVALLPVMHIVPHHELMAEHYLYLPLVGVALAAAVGLDALFRRSRLVARVLVLALVAALGLRTAARNLDWNDAWTLWESELAVTDDCARAHADLALLLWDDPQRDTPDQARLERHLRRALEIQERTIAGVSRIPVETIAAMLGAVEVSRGRVGEGLERLRWAHARVRQGGPLGRPELVHELTAVTLLNLGGAGADPVSRELLLEAREAADAWLVRAPQPARVLLLRGRASHALCDLESARADYAAVTASEGSSEEALAGAELTVETFVEEGNLAGAREALGAARARGLDSPQLQAMGRALDSGAPPPPPRCP